jgi:hypothetical protein
MIKNIKLKSGRAEGLPQETVEVMPITVFVGPNNSGKSMILSEIQRFCFDGGKNVNKLIVDSIELEAISEKLIKEKIKSVTLKPNPGEVQQPDHIFVGKQGQRQQVDSNAFLNAFKNPNENPLFICSWYLSYNTLILNGSNRINLINKIAEFQRVSCFSLSY